MNTELRENKIHGTSAYPYTQYFVGPVRHQFQYPVHWHEEIEIIYVKEGNLDLYIDGQSFVGRAGEVFFVNSKELHYMGSEDGMVQYCTMLFPLTFISFLSEDALEIKLMRPLRMGTQQFPRVITDKTMQKRLVEILERMIALNHEMKNSNQFETRILLLQIMQIMYTEGCFRENKRTKTNTFEKKLLAYIQAHYTEKMSLTELGNRFHMSGKYLSRYFKEHFSITFIQYVQHLRLVYAKELLLGTDLSVLEVALQAGFSSVNYFNRVFKEVYQTSPLQYKKEQLQQEKEGLKLDGERKSLHGN